MNEATAQQVVGRIRYLLPHALVRVDYFPAGSVWIDCPVADRVLEVQITTDHHIGMTLSAPDDAGFDGHDRVFTSVSGALQGIEELLAPYQNKHAGVVVEPLKVG